MLVLGSPPPMRGKVYKCFIIWFSVRITPAYAGKSGLQDVLPVPAEDHPRLCGEKKTIIRAKGVCIRITPAYAGKSRSAEKHCRSQEDHPRLCGEKHDCVALPACLYGSPPPMRGKDRNEPIYNICRGITPAYAGKSLRTGQRLIIFRDHPRLCGEKVNLCWIIAF